MLPIEGGDMGYSHADWLADQGILPGIKLDKIRFGHRIQPRSRLAISFMGKQYPGEEKPPPKSKQKRDYDPGYERFQLRFW
jgi:hypothetical protein